MAEDAATPDAVELVRRANDAFNRRDVDAWMSFYSADIVYRPVPSFPDSQERQGLGAMRRWMEEWHEAGRMTTPPRRRASGSTAMS
jgi:ketosteroid isomerase-like protein